MRKAKLGRVIRFAHLRLKRQQTNLRTVISNGCCRSATRRGVRAASSPVQCGLWIGWDSASVSKRDPWIGEGVRRVRTPSGKQIAISRLQVPTDRLVLYDYKLSGGLVSTRCKALLVGLDVRIGELERLVFKTE